MKNISAFLTQHPVFTREELVAFLVIKGTINTNTQTAIIQYHIKQGHIIRIKSGLFASIPAGSNPNTHPVDPYLIAGKAAHDAVLAYHTALEYHGLAYTVFSWFTFCTNKRQHPFSFRDYTFGPVLFPMPLRFKGDNYDEFFATETVKRQGIPIKVTNIERTFVDVLDQPHSHYASSWEEICRSIESIAVLNLDLVIQYAQILGKVTTIAKVGYFLEKMRDKLGVTENQLKILEKDTPKQPIYLSSLPIRKGGIFIKRWNLIIPEEIIKQQWKEPNYDA